MHQSKFGIIVLGNNFLIRPLTPLFIYTTSSFSRCHLPMLYIGLEYGLTNNSKLAERFFSQALSIAPEDPFVIHEVAVVAFQNGEWVKHKLKTLIVFNGHFNNPARHSLWVWSCVKNFPHLPFSWKMSERYFLDAMEKIKAIGNEVAALRMGNGK